MSNSTGKLLVVVLLVAVVVGALGFGAGFLVRAALVRASVTASPTLVAVEPSATPEAPTQTLAPTEVPPQPTPQATPTPPPPEPSPTSESAARSGLEAQFDLFWEVWQRIERDYYGEVPADEEILYGAIQGALDTLGDPYTGILKPEVAAIEREDLSGSFEGIGALVTMEDERLIVVEPMRGQPAEAAGVRAGDIILEVDGTPIENMNLYEAISLIRGPAGTRVRILIGREGQEPFELEITRARIEVAAVEYEMRPDGLAYARLNEFTSGASQELGQRIAEMLDQGAKGLILDLRGNPGGFLYESVLTAGLFLPRESLVLIERSKGGGEQRYTTPENPVAPDVPMVVLVNGASASASEIVAGALQDLGRAVLIGETTFGKGSVWQSQPLSNGAELRLTVAHWFTPNDRAIHGEGLEPDIVVELTAEDTEAGRDPQLDRAVEFLLSGQ